MRPTLILAVLLAIAPVLPAQAQEAVAAENMPEVAPVLPAITVSTVGLSQLSDRIIASGLIAAVEEVQVAPLVEGQPLDQLLVDVGDMVTEGQVLAVLSKTTLDLQKTEAAASLAAAKSAIAQAEAQLVESQTTRDEAQRVADRTTKLREQGTAPQAQADIGRVVLVAAEDRLGVGLHDRLDADLGRLDPERAEHVLAAAQADRVADDLLAVERV